MFQLKNSPIWSKLKAVQNNKAIYADYLTYMLGFGIVSHDKHNKENFTKKLNKARGFWCEFFT